MVINLIIVFIKENKMYGKYHDIRVYPHFVRTYSKVPYLDSEIFNLETDSLRLSRRADQRASNAADALKATEEKSNRLTVSLRESRTRKGEEDVNFMDSLRRSQDKGLEREHLAWSDYRQKRQDDHLEHIKDKMYLEELLKSTSTKAESRLTSVRRWR